MLELIGVSADAIGQVDDSVRFAGGEGSSGSVTSTVTDARASGTRLYTDSANSHRYSEGCRIAIHIVWLYG
jgi:hypothetical protein